VRYPALNLNDIAILRPFAKQSKSCHQVESGLDVEALKKSAEVRFIIANRYLGSALNLAATSLRVSGHSSVFPVFLKPVQNFSATCGKSLDARPRPYDVCSPRHVVPMAGEAEQIKNLEFRIVKGWMQAVISGRFDVAHHRHSPSGRREILIFYLFFGPGSPSFAPNEMNSLERG
jgi:hypothetical protein